MTSRHSITEQHVSQIQDHVRVLMSCLPKDLTPQEQMFVDLWTMYVRDRSRLQTTKAKARELLRELEKTRVAFKSIIDRDDLENDDTQVIDSAELERKFARRAASSGDVG